MTELLTAEQVAELLAVPKSFVYEMARRGEIPCVVLGRYRRFRREAIERWIEEQESRVSVKRTPAPLPRHPGGSPQRGGPLNG
jgi:excisionase family DNA binding protein